MRDITVMCIYLFKYPNAYIAKIYYKNALLQRAENKLSELFMQKYYPK